MTDYTEPSKFVRRTWLPEAMAARDAAKSEQVIQRGGGTVTPREFAKILRNTPGVCYDRNCSGCQLVVQLAEAYAAERVTRWEQWREILIRDGRVTADEGPK